MKTILTTMGLMMAFLAVSAKADNALTTNDLLKVASLAITDYATNNPEMAKVITGFKTTTVNQDGKVIIYMDHGGMQMTANYICVRNAGSFECRVQ